MATRIHVAVGTIGRLIRGILSAGQVHDITQEQALIQALPARYRHRNLIERFFCRIKQFRRIAT